MTLLAPLVLAGLIGLGLPLLAHLRGREEPRTIAFAGLRFLRAGDEVLIQRRRLRERLLLALRLLLLALVVVALARPVSRSDAALAVLGEPHDAVILIDGSQSMGLEVDGATLSQRARDQAAALLSALPPGSRVGLIGSDPALPRLELGADPERILAALGARQGAADPRPGRWSLADGLSAASGLLDRSDGRPRVIYAIGDRTAAGLGALPPALAGEIAVIPIAADGGPLGEADLAAAPIHVGIDEVTWEPAPELDPRALRIRATIRFHAPADPELRRRVGVLLRVDGEAITRADVEVAAGGAAPVEFTHTLTGVAGPSAATVELEGEGDPLPSDDRRGLWLAAEDTLEVVLVNGDPSEIRTHDEIFFLATALTARLGERRLRLRNLAPDQLASQVQGDPEALAGVDVLVLANVPAPAEDAAAAITRRVRAGMGLWITVGDRVDAALYNQRLGELLPLALREAVLAGTAPGLTEATSVGFAPADLDHPALRGLDTDLGLLGARARRIFLLEPDAGRPGAVALAYSNGAPALLTREVGRGRVALLTTSVDRDWSDLPLRPGFVPLAQRTITYLGSQSARVSAGLLLPGEVWQSGLPGPFTVSTPGGRSVALSADDDGVTRFHETMELGHYQAQEAAGASIVFAVNPDPRESETAPITIAAPTIADDQVLAAAHVPRWRPLLILAALALLLESILRLRGGLRLRRRRGADDPPDLATLADRAALGDSLAVDEATRARRR